jgi:multicomponent Na+:H+ antiporter subunit D
MAIAPLAIAVPILVAALLVAVGSHLPRMPADLVGVAAALATVVLCAILLGHAWHGTDITWLGGWHPRQGGVVVGIDLAVDPLGAGAATFAAGLVAAALIYSFRYFEAVTPMFHGLMLVFLAGMVGFCLTGDLFNMFVFFELMSVPAYALTAYHVEEEGPIQGALSFAVTNSIGGFLTLTGIALLYGRTGALNLAQIGQALAGHGADGLVIVAFVLLICGFLVKAAVVPFHFWLADAHAVAPVPVCVLFSGIMVQLGLFGIARVYWTVFSGVDGFQGHALGDVLLWLGVVTALLGGVMCFLQHHLKRLLAFSTVSHSGIFLVGIAMLGAHGLGATALFVLTHGATKGALFMAIGILGHRLGSVSERDLHGRGRGLWVTGLVVGLGGLALTSVPPFGPFAGKALVEEAATARGLAWVPAVLMIASALAGGAIVRAAARVFLGWGHPAPSGRGRQQSEAEDEEPETEGTSDHTPLVLIGPAVALLLVGLVIGMVPSVRHGIDHAAEIFVDRPAYAARVLHDRPIPPPHARPSTGPHTASYLYGGGAVLLAFALASGALFAPRRRTFSGVRRVGDVLHAWHSGHVGDYATWAVVGVAVVGWTLAAAVR